MAYTLQSSQTKVPTIGISAPAVTGNADTIINALGFLTKGERAIALQCAQTGFVPPYMDGPCKSTVRGSTQNIAGALEQTALVAGVKEGLGAIPVVGGALKGLASLVTLPFAHHKAAVANEQNTLCQLVPPMNQFLQQIDELLLTGQIDGRTAIQAMDQFLANWKNAAKAIYQEGKSKCNAACAYAKYFAAAAGMRKLRIQSGAVLDARGANDVNYAPIAAPPNPAGSTGQLAPLATGWNTPAPMTAAATPGFQSAGVLSLAGLTGSSQSKLAIGVVLVFGFVFVVVVNLAIVRRTK